MIKITIEELVGDIKKTTTVETDDLTLARDLLDLPPKSVVVEVTQDVPNLMIEDKWKKAIKELEESVKQDKDKSPIWPKYPTDFQPYTITC